jgi:hypothetical protein
MEYLSSSPSFTTSITLNKDFEDEVEGAAAAAAAADDDNDSSALVCFNADRVKRHKWAACHDGAVGDNEVRGGCVVVHYACARSMFNYTHIMYWFSSFIWLIYIFYY